jgi:hypothetical protein
MTSRERFAGMFPADYSIPNDVSFKNMKKIITFAKKPGSYERT